MNKLSYSPEALNDLDEIWAYIFEYLQNPKAAKNTMDSILGTIEKLREFAEMGSPLSLITEIENDYRFLVCANYMAFYRINKDEVTIDRILYCKRDYLRILFGKPTEKETE